MAEEEEEEDELEREDREVCLEPGGVPVRCRLRWFRLRPPDFPMAGPLEKKTKGPSKLLV